MNLHLHPFFFFSVSPLSNGLCGGRQRASYWVQAVPFDFIHPHFHVSWALDLHCCRKPTWWCVFSFHLVDEAAGPEPGWSDWEGFLKLWGGNVFFSENKIHSFNHAVVSERLNNHHHQHNNNNIRVLSQNPYTKQTVLSVVLKRQLGNSHMYLWPIIWWVFFAIFSYSYINYLTCLTPLQPPRGAGPVMQADSAAEREQRQLACLHCIKPW